MLFLALSANADRRRPKDGTGSLSARRRAWNRPRHWQRQRNRIQLQERRILLRCPDRIWCPSFACVRPLRFGISMLRHPFLHPAIIDAGVPAERPQRHRWNETQHLIESVPCSLIQFCGPIRYHHFFCLHFYSLLDFGKQKYVTDESTSIRNSGDAYIPSGGTTPQPPL